MFDKTSRGRSRHDAEPSTRRRRRTTPQPVVPAMLVAMAISCAVLASAVALAPRSYPSLYFVQTMFVNVYSAALLYTAALVCAANYVVARDLLGRSDVGSSLKHFWLAASIGFLVVAVDEYFDLHGEINGLVWQSMFGLKRTPALGRLDALVVAFYGAAGLALVAGHRGALVRVRGFLPCFLAGGAFAVVSILIDLFVPENHASIVVEDSAKVLAGTAFLLACGFALRSGYRRALRRRAGSDGRVLSRRDMDREWAEMVAQGSRPAAARRQKGGRSGALVDD